MAELVTDAPLDALDRFRLAYGRQPWSPGLSVDCCLALAEWLIWCGVPDPAHALRGTYASDLEFREMVARAGGIVPLVASCVPANASQTDSPRRGDIGVIGSERNIHRQFGAIHDGRGWIVRHFDGFGRMSAKTLAAWTFPVK